MLPPGGAIGGLSAAYLRNVNLLADDSPVSVVIPRAARSRSYQRLTVTHSSIPDSDLIRLISFGVIRISR